MIVERDVDGLIYMNLIRRGNEEGEVNEAEKCKV